MSAFQVNGSPRAYIASSLRERTSTVHPHACGEHLPSGYCSSSASGSSPRMWGTPPGKRKGPIEGRFIPTHVGNTGAGCVPRTRPPVHPHACGEHVSSARMASEYCGSSPRMWGTQEAALAVVDPHRFIPTHVGNTVGGGDEGCVHSVHPHACGEHPGVVHVAGGRAGSSPRMWGTLIGDSRPDALRRFIPTHVGNTAPAPATNTPTSVHPHACGEHPDGYRLIRLEHGSSPRMWGTPAVDGCVHG